MITKLTAKHENARIVLNHIETHDANLRRKVRELTKQGAALDEVLKNTPITETDLRSLVDYIEIKQGGKIVEVRVFLKET